MAFTASSVDSYNWERWAQHLPQDFSVIESSYFMTYGSLGSTAAQIQSLMFSHYSISPAYSSTPIASIATAHCRFPYAFVPYAPHQTSLLSEPTRSLFKPEFYGRSPVVPVDQDSEAASIVVTQRKSRQTGDTINPANHVNHETGVDELIGDVRDDPGQTFTLTHTPKTEMGIDAQSPANSCHAPGIKPKNTWVCDRPGCHKRFKRKFNLDRHHRVHTGDKPHICTEENCSRGFSTADSLKAHMRSHTGERPYSCGNCGKAYLYRKTLQVHKKTHGI